MNNTNEVVTNSHLQGIRDIASILGYIAVNSLRMITPNGQKLKESIKSDPESIKAVTMPSIGLLKIALETKPELIGYIDKELSQSKGIYRDGLLREHLYRFVVKRDWSAIKFIENPSLRVQTIAFSQTWEAILSVKGHLYKRPEDKDPIEWPTLINIDIEQVNFRQSDCNSKYDGLDENGQKDFGQPLGKGFESLLCFDYTKKHGLAAGRSMLTVMRNGNDLDKVEVRNDDIVAIALQNGLEDYTKLGDLSKDNQKLAISLKPELLEYEFFHLIGHPSEETITLALKRDTRNIEYVSLRNCYSKEIITIALEIDARTIADAPLGLVSPTQLISALRAEPSLWPNILEKNGLFIKHLDSPSEDLQIIAVRNNPAAIGEIRNPCEEAQIIAFRKDPTVIHLVENPTPEAKKVAYESYKQSEKSQKGEIRELKNDNWRYQERLRQLDGEREIWRD